MKKLPALLAAFVCAAGILSGCGEAGDVPLEITDFASANILKFEAVSEDFDGPDKPSCRYKVTNTGTETLSSLKFTCEFLNADGEKIGDDIDFNWYPLPPGKWEYADVSLGFNAAEKAVAAVITKYEYHAGDKRCEVDLTDDRYVVRDDPSEVCENYEAYNVLDFTFGALEQNGAEYVFPLSVRNQSTNPVFVANAYVYFTDKDGNILSTAGPYEYNRVKADETAELDVVSNEEGTAGAAVYTYDYVLEEKDSNGDILFSVHPLDDYASGSTSSYWEEKVEEVLELESADPNETAVQRSYEKTISITVDDLTQSESVLGNTIYSYKGLPLLSYSNQWIESPLNTKGTVAYSAVYLKLAKLLEAFGVDRDAGNKWTDYAKWIIGYLPETRDEFKPYVKNAMEFITLDQPLKRIMEKFESLDCVDGSFDYENKIFKFSVEDASQAASEMEISEECLGYILAFLREYGDCVQFDGKKLLVDYTATGDFDYAIHLDGVN